MAIAIHIVRVGFMTVNSLGAVVSKEAGSTATIGEMTDFSNDHRVLEDSGIASSVGSPTVPDYIEAEAVLDFVVHYMDQNMIITYEHAAGPLP